MRDTNLFSRIKKVDKTAISSIKNLIIRPFGMILGMVYTPLLLNYLGDEANGVWATVLSVITWINFLDLGIGNGLRNVLATEIAKQDYKNARKSISTAYIVLSGIAAVLLAIMIFLVFTLDWSKLLNTTLFLRPMLIITVAYIALNFVLALSNSILYALQKSEMVSLRSCLVQIINIIVLVIIGFTNDEGNLTYVAILFGSSTAIVYLYNTIMVFHKRRDLAPSVKSFDKLKIKSITSTGVQFLVIQLTSVLILSSQNFIISNLFGAAEVTPVHTVNNVFAAVYSVIAAIMVPFWSRTTEAIAKGEFSWLRNSMKKVQLISCAFIPIIVLLAFFFEDLSKIWLQRELSYQPGVILTTCIFYIVNIENLAFTQFYYGIGEITPYMWITVIEAIIIVPLAIFLSRFFGVAGVKLASIIMLSISGIALPILTYKKIKQKEKIYGGKLK